MKKLRILLIRGGAPNGVSYHRLLRPHKVLCQQYEYDVHDCDAIEQVSDETLKSFDIVIGNRTIASVGEVDKQIEQINRIKKAGPKVVLDLDDYWHLHKNHELSSWWAKHNMTSVIISNIKNADYITVTHEVIGQLTKRNYTILPNGLDNTEIQFERKTRAIRNTLDFGWCGSSNHIYDINLMSESLKRLNEEQVNYRMNFLGWNPEMKHSKYYEWILTGLGTAKDNQYTNIAGKEVDTYGALYDHIDVALIPLVDNPFNNCKSNLKMLEAGVKGKAVIVSNVYPYTSILKHEKNCLKVNPTDNHNGWYKAIKRLVNNPNMVIDLANQLHEDVKPYNLANLVKTRHEFYQSIIK